MDERLPEQEREERTRLLGPDLGPLYHALCDEVQWLHVKWQQYKTLYSTPDSVDLLNRIAGFFFGVVQGVMWDDLILHIARLNDEPKSGRGGKEHLTFKRLAGAISDDPALKQDIQGLAKVLGMKASFIRDWRDCHLAHRELALDAQAKPLPKISYENMEQVLSAMVAVLNRIEWHYCESEVQYHRFLDRTGARSLIGHLQTAARAEDWYLEQLDQGQVVPEGFEP